MVKTIKKYNINKKFTKKKGGAKSGEEGCLEKGQNICRFPGCTKFLKSQDILDKYKNCSISDTTIDEEKIKIIESLKEFKKKMLDERRSDKKEGMQLYKFLIEEKQYYNLENLILIWSPQDTIPEGKPQKLWEFYHKFLKGGIQKFTNDLLKGGIKDENILKLKSNIGLETESIQTFIIDYHKGNIKRKFDEAKDRIKTIADRDSKLEECYQFLDFDSENIKFKEIKDIETNDQTIIEDISSAPFKYKMELLIDFLYEQRFPISELYPKLVKKIKEIVPEQFLHKKIKGETFSDSFEEYKLTLLSIIGKSFFNKYSIKEIIDNGLDIIEITGGTMCNPKKIIGECYKNLFIEHRMKGSTIINSKDIPVGTGFVFDNDFYNGKYPDKGVEDFFDAILEARKSPSELRERANQLGKTLAKKKHKIQKLFTKVAIELTTKDPYKQKELKKSKEDLENAKDEGQKENKLEKHINLTVNEIVDYASRDSGEQFIHIDETQSELELNGKGIGARILSKEYIDKEIVNRLNQSNDPRLKEKTNKIEKMFCLKQEPDCQYYLDIDFEMLKNREQKIICLKKNSDDEYRYEKMYTCEDFEFKEGIYQFVKEKVDKYINNYLQEKEEDAEELKKNTIYILSRKYFTYEQRNGLSKRAYGCVYNLAKEAGYSYNDILKYGYVPNKMQEREQYGEIEINKNKVLNFLIHFSSSPAYRMNVNAGMLNQEDPTKMETNAITILKNSQLFQEDLLNQYISEFEDYLERFNQNLEKNLSFGGKRKKKLKKNKKKTFKINKKRNKYKKSLKKHRGGCNDADFWANLHLHI